MRIWAHFKETYRPMARPIRGRNSGRDKGDGALSLADYREV